MFEEEFKETVDSELVKLYDKKLSNNKVRVRCGVCLRFHNDFKCFKLCNCGLPHYICKQCIHEGKICQLEIANFNETCSIFVEFMQMAGVERVYALEKAVDSFIESVAEDTANKSKNTALANQAQFMDFKNINFKSAINDDALFKQIGTPNLNTSLFNNDNPRDNLLTKYPDTTPESKECFEKIVSGDLNAIDQLKPPKSVSTSLCLPSSNLQFSYLNPTSAGAIIVPIKTIVLATNQTQSIITVDFTSLYPSLISRYKLDNAHTCCQPELKFFDFEGNFINSDDDSQFITVQIALKISGVYVNTFCRFYKKDSNSSKYFRSLLSLRVSVKKSKPNLSNALKLLLNSVYGSTICVLYPTYNIFVGGSVLSLEHVSLIRLHAIVSFVGGEIYGGDTDSLHFKINKEHEDIWKTFNKLPINEDILKIEMEHRWKLMIMFVRKRYCGWYFDDCGEKVGFISKGLIPRNCADIYKSLTRNFIDTVIGKFNTFSTSAQSITEVCKIVLACIKNQLVKFANQMVDYGLFLKNNFDKFIFQQKRTKAPTQYKNWESDFVCSQLLALNDTIPAACQPNFFMTYVKMNKSLVCCIDPTKIDKKEPKKNYLLVVNHCDYNDVLKLHEKYNVEVDLLYLFERSLKIFSITLLKSCTLTKEVYSYIISIQKLSLETFKCHFYSEINIKKMFFDDNKCKYTIQNKLVNNVNVNTPLLDSLNIFLTQHEYTSFQCSTTNKSKFIEDLKPQLVVRDLEFKSNAMFKKESWKFYVLAPHWKYYFKIREGCLVAKNKMKF